MSEDNPHKETGPTAQSLVTALQRRLNQTTAEATELEALLNDAKARLAAQAVRIQELEASTAEATPKKPTRKKNTRAR